MAVARIDNLGGGGIELEDINPDKVYGARLNKPGIMSTLSYEASQTWCSTLPVSGYEKVALYPLDGAIQYAFNNSEGSPGTFTTVSASRWTDYIDIPKDAYVLFVKSSGSGNYYRFNYSLLTNKRIVPSPYNIELVDVNPDNLTSGDNCYGFEFVKNAVGEWYRGSRINVGGYEKIKIYTHPSYYSNCKYKFQLSDGTFTAEFNATSGWSDYIDIPRNAVGLWGSNTSGTTLLNYYSLYTDKQVIPTKVTADVNPNKVNTGQIAGRLAIGSGSGGVNNYIPINGYKKIAVFKGSSDTTKIRWVYSDGTESSDIATLSQNVWTSYYDIPSNAVCMKFTATFTSTSWCEIYYSLLV